MHLISLSTLKSLGFSNPDKVNVYGAGGRMLPEQLTDKMTDDLPIIPSVVTPEGILFFGHGNVSWTTTANYPAHTLNPYSQEAFYFISDKEAERPMPEESTVTTPELTTPITTFQERLLHEQDLMAPSNTGRLLLGEDFITQSSRTFSFALPDNTGEIFARISFGAMVTNGVSTLDISLNGGENLSNKIAGVASAETFLIKQSFNARASKSSKLDIKLDYSHTGIAKTAALDYIEVFYPRELRLKDNQLYFYLQPSRAVSVRIEGCNESTQIWDVSNPLVPILMNYEIDGTAVVFTSSEGYHEYVAFNPAKCGTPVSSAGNVRNQDIHSIEIPDMLIIAPEAFKGAASRLADLHQQTDGLKSVVLTPEEIYNEFSSGVPDVTAFRKLLKMWYDRAIGAGVPHTRYCLIFSRPTYDNKLSTPGVKRQGYPRIPIWQTETNFSENTSYSTDDYIGMLEDNILPLNMNSAKIQVAVGRMPAKTVSEAESVVTKLEKYLKEPTRNAWRNSIMIIADDQDNGVHLSQAETVHSTLTSQDKGKNFTYEKLYFDSYTLSYSGTGAVYPEAKSRLLEKWNEGVLWIDYIGHGSPKSWTHENVLTWSDITGLRNRNLPFLYAATCNFLRWDADDISGGEEMWLNPDGGVIGLICPSRSVYITLNGTLNIATSKYLFSKDEEGRQLAVGDIMVKGKNSLSSDNNRLRYGFCGDPALRLPIPEHNIRIESIDGVSVTNQIDLPVLGARSQFRLDGVVTDNDGSIIEDFNGIAELSVYDAEKVVTTNGNGADGKVVNYNDRSSKLYSGRVKVIDGKWSTTVYLPSEIENNFSQALISLYAASDNGREANGSFDGFYIYGFDAGSPEDNEGPEISGMYLNTPSFTDGSSVNPSPTLLANFSDPSGINISDVGIGHNISVSIDNKKFFSDVALYYLPDSENPTRGSISYPLKNMEPGDHTLTLTVWDNANNSSSASLNFKVAADWQPSITTLYTDTNPATSSVTFIVATDGVSEALGCSIEVLDLNGKIVWTSPTSSLNGSSNSVKIGWNLNSVGGSRVPRGIYLYRATLKDKDGRTVTKTRKLAVTA